ncbi:hypothetical protein [Zavarzinia sp.]|uniref:hypothetical protein n=1 Tax=Zavarzinia sp. TaxID=2027920 RepID=UPI0035620A8A
MLGRIACLAVACFLAGCADPVEQRTRLDTLPPQPVAGKGEAVAIAQCVYDRVLTKDCQDEDQRLLLTKDMAGDIVVMCDEHPGYAGLHPTSSIPTVMGAALLGGAIGVAAVSYQADKEASDTHHYPLYSLTLRAKPPGEVEGRVWALNKPDLGSKRLAMMAEAFGACSPAPK